MKTGILALVLLCGSCRGDDIPPPPDGPPKHIEAPVLMAPVGGPPIYVSSPPQDNFMMGLMVLGVALGAVSLVVSTYALLVATNMKKVK